MLTEYRYQGITLSKDDLLECYAEKVVPEFLRATSFSHSVRRRKFDDRLIVQGPHGVDITILASSVKLTVKAFLKPKELKGPLTLSSDISQLAKEHRDYLRTTHRQKCLKEKRDSNYYLLETEDDLNWLYNICFLAIVEYIACKKDREDDFVDKRSGMLVTFALGMRDMRGHIAEGDNHNKKNKYVKSNSEDVEDANEEAVMDKWFKKYEDLVENLSARGLPDFKLPPLPEGVQPPLQLPMGVEKKKGKSRE